MATATRSAHRLCTAPMMDWSDRHCRYFFRQLAPHARLYTEMVTTGALLHGDSERHLRFDAIESPVALQLGGSEPEALARCAQLGAAWGYDEINLNCGCPSERVRQGAFGACLMHEPELVGDCVRAMREAVSIPVTVKHRLGVDASESFDFVRRFVEIVAGAGCDTFIVHARNAVLSGLSPKDNRSVPRLRYDDVYGLKQEFPRLSIVLNGGVDAPAAIHAHLARVDGVMLGRAAYHDAYLLATLDAQLFGGFGVVACRCCARDGDLCRAGSAGRHTAAGDRASHARPVSGRAAGAGLAAHSVRRVAAGRQRPPTAARSVGLRRGQARCEVGRGSLIELRCGAIGGRCWWPWCETGSRRGAPHVAGRTGSGCRRSACSSSSRRGPGMRLRRGCPSSD